MSTTHEHDLEAGAAPKQGHHHEAGGTDSLLAQAALRAGRPDALGAAGAAHLQRLAGNAGVAALIQRAGGEGDDIDGSSVHQVIASGGRPLDPAVRSDMESRLGHDFSDVRIHTGGAAEASARAVQAHAYTTGSNIVFGAGQYDPTSHAGRHTLAHELTHVVQQRSGPVDGTAAPGGVAVSDPSDPYERHAEASASAAMAAEPSVSPMHAAAAASVQRQADGPATAEEPDQALQRSLAPTSDEEHDEEGQGHRP